MSFRLRIALVAAAAVALAVLVASASAYVALRHSARQQVDDSLLREARRVQDTFHLGDGSPAGYDAPLSGPATEAGGFEYQLVTGADRPGPPSSPAPGLPVTEQVRRVVAGERAQHYSDVRRAGAHLRVLTVNVGSGVALQVARHVGEVDRSLRSLAAILLLVGIGGIAMGAGLGWLVSRTAVRPLSALSAAAEHATATGDLSRSIPVTGADELGRLGRSFNALFQSLDRSLRAQRQLVADASHELRTPLTSLRTNVEVLTRDGLGPADRERLVADVIAQFEELTLLLGDLTELAREDEAGPELEEVRLDQVVAAVAERMAPRARAAGVQVSTHLSPSAVMGSSAPLERAVANLLDNAIKWSPAGATVEVAVAGGEVTVRDHGPGIAAADLSRVFDRFYRAPEARDLPGSGLGLAIVRRIAEHHGGTVAAETPTGGGARLRLRLPPVDRPVAGAGGRAG